jgi:antitoxin (DNA-binding transcriptional repressor) of toxin-antitoxin stability system
MSTATATIRELRTDFRAVKRKLEQHGSLVITDNGVPRYEMKPLTSQRNGRVSSMPDYMARLRKRQPKPMTAEATRRFWEEERGRC